MMPDPVQPRVDRRPALGGGQRTADLGRGLLRQVGGVLLIPAKLAKIHPGHKAALRVEPKKSELVLEAPENAEGIRSFPGHGPDPDLSRPMERSQTVAPEAEGDASHLVTALPQDPLRQRARGTERAHAHGSFPAVGDHRAAAVNVPSVFFRRSKVPEDFRLPFGQRPCSQQEIGSLLVRLRAREQHVTSDVTPGRNPAELESSNLFELRKRPAPQARAGVVLRGVPDHDDGPVRSGSGASLEPPPQRNAAGSRRFGPCRARVEATPHVPGRSAGACGPATRRTSCARRACEARRRPGVTFLRRRGDRLAERVRE
jgi:hypothetical protein